MPPLRRPGAGVGACGARGGVSKAKVTRGDERGAGRGAPRAQAPREVPQASRAVLQKALLAALGADAVWLADGGEGLCAEVERELLRTAAEDDAGRRRYAPRGRALCAALKRNADLRSRLVAHELSAAALVALADDPAALARGSAAGKERERLRARALAKATVDSAKAAHRTTEHACPACGAKDAGYTYVGGERDIRKAEVWGTGAGSEGVQIQLECRECRHAWVKDVD